VNYYLVVLSSVTTAKRVEKAASDMMISCFVVHTPKGLSKYGCSHSVKVKEQDVKRVLEICRKMALEIRGVFREIKQDGRVLYKEEKF
jgi:hypothetical protein